MTSTIQLRGRTVCREDILRTLAKCDQLGKLGFLEKHGYSDSVRYHLRHEGRSYPSKAILGVAAGLDSSQFFGGAAHTVAQLATLGFFVRNSETGEIIDPELDGLRRRCLAQGLDVGEKPWVQGPVAPLAYFCSGSNQPGEILGMSKAGADIGVAVPNVTPSGEAELVKLKGSDIQVFVDSGAFSEVKFNPATFEFDAVKPMGVADWQRVMSLYHRLGKALGSQLWIVAPDRVGCQKTSLQRLYSYRAQLARLRDLGVRILVPCQKGDLSLAEYAAQVDEALGFTDWFPAMPCKKAATTPVEVAQFVRERKPEHVHLLGVGPRSRSYTRFLQAFVGSDCSVSLDSCWLTANVGKTNGPGGGPRRLTKARGAAKAVLGLTGGLAVIELAVYTCLAGSGLYA